MPTSHFVHINGLRLHYLAWGAPGRPLLVCLHGLTAHAGLWDEFARKMTDHFHVIALDQRGHGESQWAEDGYDLGAYVADLAAFLAHLAVKPVFLIGHSLGGMVSIQCAAARPDRILRLVSVDISPAPGDHVLRGMREGGRYPSDFASLDEAVDWARTDYLWTRGEALRRDLARRLRQQADGRWIWRADLSLSEENWRDLWAHRSEELWGAFTKVVCPILIIRGEESDVLSDAIRDRMLASNSRCEWVDIPGAAHNPVNETPRAFLEVVRPFLLRS